MKIRRLLLQHVYLNPAVRELEKESREVFFGVTVDAESYRNDLLALLEEFK